MLIEVGVLYTLAGICLQALMRRDTRFAARVLTVFVWPVLLCLEGTPAMEQLVKWSKC